MFVLLLNSNCHFPLANLIATEGRNTTAHEERQRGRCHNCGGEGNNSYQIVYKGNSDLAMAGVGSVKDDLKESPQRNATTY